MDLTSYLTSYAIVKDGAAILCLHCGHTSYDPRDVEHKYCGFCKKFHDFEEKK